MLFLVPSTARLLRNKKTRVHSWNSILRNGKMRVENQTKTQVWDDSRFCTEASIKYVCRWRIPVRDSHGWDMLVPRGGVGAGRLPLQHRQHRPRPKHNIIRLKGQSHAIQNIISIRGSLTANTTTDYRDSFTSLKHHRVKGTGSRCTTHFQFKGTVFTPYKT